MSACTRPGCTNRPYQWGDGYCESHARMFGTAHHRHDTSEAKATIARLVDQGYSMWDIHKATGLQLAHLKQIVDGSIASINHATHEAISNPPNQIFRGLIPAWRGQRRIRSLQSAGHTLRQIQDKTGLSYTGLANIAIGANKHIRANIFHALDTYWQEHLADPVGEPTCKEAAFWKRPMAWDEIDDPDENGGNQQFQQILPVTPRHVNHARDLISFHGNLARASHASGIGEKALKRLASGDYPRARYETIQLLHGAYRYAKRVGLNSRATA